MNRLIETIAVPDEVKKTRTHRHFDYLDVYDNKIIGRTAGKQDIAWYYSDLTDIQVVHASLNMQFAQLVLMNAKNPNALRARDHFLVAYDNNRIMFSCGTIPRPKILNPFVDSLLAKILPIFRAFKDGRV